MVVVGDFTCGSTRSLIQAAHGSSNPQGGARKCRAGRGVRPHAARPRGVFAGVLLHGNRLPGPHPGPRHGAGICAPRPREDPGCH